MRDFTQEASEDYMGLKSKINAAGLINVTLENLWGESFKHQAKNNLWAWNRKLDSVWLILGGDCDEKDEKTAEFNAIEMEIGKSGSLVHKGTGFNPITKEDITRMAIQYRLLMKKSLFLRRLQNKQGKGTAYIDAMEDEFD